MAWGRVYGFEAATVALLPVARHAFFDCFFMKAIIGIGAPLSGLAAALGREMVQAIELAVSQFNQAGSPGGSEIETMVCDDGSDVRTAGAVATEFCRNEAVAGVVGHYSSDTSLAAAKIYAQAGLALVAPIASNPSLTESGIGGVFRYTNRDDRTARAMSDYLVHRRGKRRAVVVRTDSAYGNSMAGAFECAFAQSGGTVAGSFVVRQGETDLRELVGRLPGDFDVLFYGGTFEGAPLLTALRAAGFSQLMATGDGCWDVVNFLRPAGEALDQGEGVVVLSASAAVGDIEGSEAFAEAYRRAYGDIINYALNSYDCARLLLRAIGDVVGPNPSAAPDRQAVGAALRRVRVRGLANDRVTDWDANGDNRNAITRLYTAHRDGFAAITV